jgi:hypothetical protein
MKVGKSTSTSGLKKQIIFVVSSNGLINVLEVNACIA